MRIYESGEMYLETIFELLRKNGTVRSVDIVLNCIGYRSPLRIEGDSSTVYRSEILYVSIVGIYHTSSRGDHTPM